MTTKVDLNKTEVVYFHRHAISGAVFHIGSGKIDRAFSAQRGVEWLKFTSELDSYEVEIVEYHQCPARARLREAELIFALQPLTNLHHRKGPHRQVLRGFTKGGQRCDCKAPNCYGLEALRLYP